MAKKESHKKESPRLGKGAGERQTTVSGKKSFIPPAVLNVIKLIVGICLLPFAYSFAAAFIVHVGRLSGVYQAALWSGAGTFLFFFLFIAEPVEIYNAGHRLLEIAFSSFQPLVKVAPDVLPIYTIIVFLVYALLSLFGKGSWLGGYTIYLMGLCTVLHLVFCAKNIRSQKDDFLKSDYILKFTFIFIVNILLLGLFLSCVSGDFAFGGFFIKGLTAAANLFAATFKQLFWY